MAEIVIEYFEDLSNCGCTCPHEDAICPDGSKKYYRAVKFKPATSESFLPTEIKDGQVPPDKCIIKSVSIFDNIESLKNGYFRTPAFKKRQRLAAELPLTEKDGVLKKTFSPGHHSWWRSKTFDPSIVYIIEVPE